MSRWRERTVFRSPACVARKIRCRRLRTRLLACRQLTAFQSVCRSVPVTDGAICIDHIPCFAIVASLLRGLTVPRQHPFRLGSTLSARLWFPVVFRLAAFASWVSYAR